MPVRYQARLIANSCIKAYRNLFSGNLSPRRRATKNTVYGFALFMAKRRGFLPFFYNKEERAYINSCSKNQTQSQISSITYDIRQTEGLSEYKPLVSIIIPTKDNTGKLARCLDGIKTSAYKNYEIIIITNSKKKKTLDFLHKTGHRILTYEEQFNYSRINNLAAKDAKGAHLLFLNDDVEPLNNDWLESMLSYSAQKDVGVVGALLFFPKSPFYDLTIQHAGVLIGVGGPAVHAFSFSHYGKPHYGNLHRTTRKVSAVTGACMMIQKDVFEKLGGFDENFVLVFGDTDICLRARQKGYYTVCDSDAKLFHHEGSTRGANHPIEDEILFLKKWEDTMLKGDEFYDKSFSRLYRDFTPSPSPTETPALSLLLEVYYLREDLQKRFPKITEQDHQALINWAATEGVAQDIARTALVPYNKYYKERCSTEKRELADSIYEFNHSVELQTKFPEVFSGKYDRLVSHLKNVQDT